MWDKRIIRGNTFGSSFVPSRETQQLTRASQSKTKLLSNRGFDATGIQAVPGEVSTPKARDGCYHIDCQTDENIEILQDKPPDYEKDTQTDFYIDRPVNRLFIPKKHGEDKSTQIQEGELFDFDREVKPILQTIVTKTLEQARMEVLEEEELKRMKDE